MAERKAKTMALSGNDYAKVAERLKLFRTDWPNSKTQSAYEYDVDGTVAFTVWLWKEKSELIELMKSGVVDKDVLRESCDANGTAKGQIGQKQKDFEKLETIALGRALANMGYLASGEIASFEEMEAFDEFKEHQHQQAVAEAIDSMQAAKTLDELKQAFVASQLMSHPEVVKAKDKRKAELTPKVAKEAVPAKPANPPGPAKLETSDADN